MFIQITEKQLAQMKQDLECLKQAQDLAKKSEVIPVSSYRYDMQNLIGGSIVWLQQIIEHAESR